MEDTRQIETISQKDREKIRDLSKVYRLFYKVISDPSDFSEPQEVYENKDWISGLGDEFNYKLDDFIESGVQHGWALTETMVKDLASRGEVEKAQTLIDSLDGKRLENVASVMDHGLTLYQIKQGELLQAVESASKVDNLHECLDLWVQIIEKVSADEKEGVWEHIGNLLTEKVSKNGQLYVHNVSTIVDSLVKVAFESGNVEKANEILKLAGELTEYVDEIYDDIDTGRSFPRKESYVSIGEGYVKIGDLGKAKKWMKKGGLVDEERVEQIITNAMFDWGFAKAGDVIARLEKTEADEDSIVSEYTYKAEEWFENKDKAEKVIFWKWLQNNSKFIEGVKKEEKVGRIFSLWELSKQIGGINSQFYLDKLLEIAEAKKDNLVLSEVYVRLSETADDEPGQLLEKAWKELNIGEINVKYHKKIIERILNGWLRLGSKSRIESALEQLPRASDSQNLKDDLGVNLLLLKFHSLTVKDKHGSLSTSNLDFELIGLDIVKSGFKSGQIDEALLLLNSNSQLDSLTRNMTEDQKVLIRLRLAFLKESISIESAPFESVTMSWIKRQLNGYLGKEGNYSREIVKGSIEHITKFGGREDKKYLLDLLFKKSKWWNDGNEIREDMTLLINSLYNTVYFDKKREEKFFEIAKKIVEDCWKRSDGEMLDLAAGMLTSGRNENAGEFLITWISDHIEDFETKDENLVKSRLRFLEIGLEHNIPKLSYLSYQLIGEKIFDDNHVFWVLEKLSENRFLDPETYEWLHDFSESKRENETKKQIIDEVTELIKRGILLRKEFLEPFFKDLNTSFDERFEKLKDEGVKEAKSFKVVFERDLNDWVKKLGEVRCIIGSIYGEPVLLFQNFASEIAPVNGHHDILSSWNKNAEVVNTEDDGVVHRFIGKLVEDNELPVEHFLRGWIRFDEKRNEFILRSDDGFTQSSESARAELILKVTETAKRYGIARIEQIPHNEYAELQRVGFMRGVVKDFTKIIEDNLGKNEAQKFSNLARRFFINQEFDINSRPYEILRSYLDLIDYYRMVNRNKYN